MNRVTSAAAYQRNGVHTEPKPAASAGDRVDLSDHARMVAHMQAMPEVRLELVEQARSAIDDPAYLSDDRLNAALDSLLDDINSDEALR